MYSVPYLGLSVSVEGKVGRVLYREYCIDTISCTLVYTEVYSRIGSGSLMLEDRRRVRDVGPFWGSLGEGQQPFKSSLILPVMYMLSRKP